MKHYYLYIDTLSDVTFLSTIDHGNGFRTIENEMAGIQYCIFFQQSKLLQNFYHELLLKTFICIEVEL